MTLTITLDLTPTQEQELQESIATHDKATARKLIANAIEPAIEALFQEKPRRLSLEEFKALSDELVEAFAASIGPDTPILSDYAMSREGIYEGYPEL